MRFIEDGFPVVQNCDDGADSPVLAGMLQLVNHPDKIDMNKYYLPLGKPSRYPLGETALENNPRCFSRDQTILLVAGEWAEKGLSNFAPRLLAPNDMDEVTGKWKMPDVFSPSAINHLRLCYGEKGSWLGFKWLELDILYNGKFTPLREQNQLQAMCIVATEKSGTNYVKKYVEANPYWAKATIFYWCDAQPNAYNRGEPELAEMIIKKIRSFSHDTK